MKITAIHPRMILDSRGNPTVEVEAVVDGAFVGRAAVPAGASTGRHEAVELRDGGRDYGGLGVNRALENISRQIAPRVIGLDPRDQGRLDQTMIELDGTPNKSRLGANAILAVSLAVAKAAAHSTHQPFYGYIAGPLAAIGQISLPLPMFNVINGGKHAAGSTDIQEFLLLPIGAATVHEAVRMAAEVYHALGQILRRHGYATTVGDEGGYAPSFKHGDSEALDSLVAAIIAAGYKPGSDMALGMDVAASELTEAGGYRLDGQARSAAETVAYYQSLQLRYPLLSIEDGLGEDDWDGWQLLARELGTTTQLVGDDLLVTNPQRLGQAVKLSAANAILIKPNQIGTLTETIQTVSAARDAGWNTVISHRSGETEDTAIAHLAVGLAAGQIKAGAPARSERTAKYNELLRIETAVAGHAGLSVPKILRRS